MNNNFHYISLLISPNWPQHSIPEIDVLIIQVVLLSCYHRNHHPITLHVIQGKFELQILHKRLSVFFLKFTTKKGLAPRYLGTPLVQGHPF
jgi:hypothetical protein